VSELGAYAPVIAMLFIVGHTVENGWPRRSSGLSGPRTAGCETPTINGRTRGSSNAYSWFLFFSDRPSRERGSEFCWAQSASWRVEDSPQDALRHDKTHTNRDFRNIRSSAFPVLSKYVTVTALSRVLPIKLHRSKVNAVM